MKDLLAIITDVVVIVQPYLGNHSHSKMLVQINSNTAHHLASVNVDEHIGGTLFCPDFELTGSFLQANIFIARLR